MHSEQLVTTVIQLLEDAKAADILSLDVRALTSVTDFLVICTGRSNRHTRSIGDNLAERLKLEYGVRPFSVTGTETGEWVLVDIGDVVAHIMLPEPRAYYNLEKLWGYQPQTANKEES